MPEYLSTTEVAKRLNVSARTIRYMIERGDIPADAVIKLGPRSTAVLASFVATLQPKPEGQYHFSIRVKE